MKSQSSSTNETIVQKNNSAKSMLYESDKILLTEAPASRVSFTQFLASPEHDVIFFEELVTGRRYHFAFFWNSYNQTYNILKYITKNTVESSYGIFRSEWWDACTVVRTVEDIDLLLMDETTIFFIEHYNVIKSIMRYKSIRKSMKLLHKLITSPNARTLSFFDKVQDHSEFRKSLAKSNIEVMVPPPSITATYYYTPASRLWNNIKIPMIEARQSVYGKPLSIHVYKSKNVAINDISGIFVFNALWHNSTWNNLKYTYLNFYRRIRRMFTIPWNVNT